MDNKFNKRKAVLSTAGMLRVFAEVYNFQDKMENFQELSDDEKREILRLLSFSAIATFGTLTGITNIAACACLMGSSAESVSIESVDSGQNAFSQADEDWVTAQVSRIFKDQDEGSDQ